MIQTPAELTKILQSTILKDSNIASLEIPESQQLALAIEVPRSKFSNDMMIIFKLFSH